MPAWKKKEAMTAKSFFSRTCRRAACNYNIMRSVHNAMRARPQKEEQALTKCRQKQKLKKPEQEATTLDKHKIYWWPNQVAESESETDGQNLSLPPSVNSLLHWYKRRQWRTFWWQVYRRATMMSPSSTWVAEWFFFICVSHHMPVHVPKVDPITFHRGKNISTK